MKPLTRADVERALREIGRPSKLDLSGENLEGIDLAYLDLNGATLAEAKLMGAKLREANLFRTNLHAADLRGAYLGFADLRAADLRGAVLDGAALRGADLSGANLEGASLYRDQLRDVRLSGDAGLNVKNEEAEDNVSTLGVRIIEEPLTAQNFAIIISALTELHTKCWLIVKDRFGDLIEYTQTRNPRFSEEAHLVIERIAHNSPLELKLNPGVKEIAEALKEAIDAVSQAHVRYERGQLENEAQRLANEAAALKMKQDELAVQSSLKDKEQARQIETQQAELNRQKALLEIQKQQLEVEQQQVVLQRAMLESEHQRVSLAFETASRIVERVAPDADAANKAMLIQSLLPQLLQLESGKGLKLAYQPHKAGKGDQR